MAMMTAEEAAEWGKTLTFEKVWAALMESKQQIDKNAKEMAELKKTVERVTKNVGGLNRSVGELVETLIAAHLWEKFPQYNLKRSYQRLPIYDENSETQTDIDILLVDTNLCMIVEVKRELDRRRDVDAHLKRMEIIQQYPPELIVGKEMLGAMAGGVVDPEVRKYAYQSGFYVLELKGESVRLIRPPKDFEPRKWQGKAAAGDESR